MARGFEEDPVFVKVKRSAILTFGHGVIKRMVSHFESLSVDATGHISTQVWMDALRQFGVAGLTADEVRYLTKAFDPTACNRINVGLFIRTLVGTLPPRRSVLVKRAFATLQRTHESVTTDVLRQRLLPHAEDPWVKSFVDDFEAAFGFSQRHEHDEVSLEEFLAFHVGIHAAILHDEYFESFVLRAWGVDDPTRPRLDATAREWSTSEAPLEVAPPPLASTSHSSVLSYLTTKTSNNRHIRPVSHPQPLPSVLPKYVSTNGSTFVSPQATAHAEEEAPHCRTLRPVAGATDSRPPLLRHLFRRISAESQKDGFQGFRRLLLRRAEERRGGGAEGTGALTRQDVLDVAKEFGTALSPLEAVGLWPHTHPTKDNASALAVLRALRGTLTGRRESVVREVFGRMALPGNTHVALRKLCERYDAAVQPAVRKGKTSVERERQNFVDAWPAETTAVSAEGLISYYADVSPAVVDDATFEAMVRNTWHVPPQ